MRAELGYLGVGLAAVVGLVQTGQAQVRVVSSDPSCATCRIVVEQVTVLDGLRVDEVGVPLALAVLSDGRVLGSFNEFPAELQVFSPEGRHLGTVGRRGHGPGEFQFIQHIASAPNGQIHVLDTQLRRLTVLDGDLRVVRTTSLAAPVELLGLLAHGSGSVVINGLLRSPEHVGFLLHEFRVDGAHVRSFGDEISVDRSAGTAESWRRLALGAGGVWAADRVRYRIARFDGSGRRTLELVRAASWFAGPGTLRSVTDDSPPAPDVSGIWEDNGGRLWVIVTTPDRRWRTAITAGPVRHGRPTFEVADANRWLDTVIEVIDPASGQLVTSVSVDAAYNLGFVGNGLVAGHTSAALGTSRISIARLSLQHQTSTGLVTATREDVWCRTNSRPPPSATASPSTTGSMRAATWSESA